ncbi:hypothetical protein [Tersicoccus sp. Bi-70]|uniref:hypothetical protein n=1 Tax=Tersicoccus sp. Bi-70 TaxID=1897634 RepID=UPI000978A097|nr:hypothetical protein [Tersicoccus sp. Bi-70]OMH35107.1 hypothetical protein BGP79_01965 [Tersicoccus sp. Bi-70]
MRFLRTLVLLGLLAGVVVVGAAWYLGGQRSSGAVTGGPVAGMDASLADGGSRRLTSDDVDHLRAAGWTCPDLNTVGYWIESAELTERGGAPAVVADLRSTAHTVTLVEQHPGSTASTMVDGATGRTVSTAAFRQVSRNGTELWVARSGTPATSDVVFRVADAVYSLRSDTSTADAMKVASVIAAADKAQVDRSAPAAGDGVLDRVARVLSRMAGQP